MKVPVEYRLSKNVRASRLGTLIYCSNCDMPTKVYNFAWTTLKCWSCKKDFKKIEWNSISKYQYKVKRLKD